MSSVTYCFQKLGNGSSGRQLNTLFIVMTDMNVHRGSIMCIEGFVHRLSQACHLDIFT